MREPECASRWAAALALLISTRRSRAHRSASDAHRPMAHRMDRQHGVIYTLARRSPPLRPTSALPGNMDARIERIMALVEGDVSLQWSTRALASEVRPSASRLRHLVCHDFGVSLSDNVTRRRFGKGDRLGGTHRSLDQRDRCGSGCRRCRPAIQAISRALRLPPRRHRSASRLNGKDGLCTLVITTRMRSATFAGESATQRAAWNSSGTAVSAESFRCRVVG